MTKYDDDGDELWSETFNLVDTSANVIVGQIALDGTGAPIVTGAVYNGNTNDYDAFTVKHNTSGVYQWHALYNGNCMERYVHSKYIQFIRSIDA